MNDEKLIEEVRAREILYNKACVGYRVPSRKRDAWVSVAKELGATEQCSKRWLTLRERFSREVRKMEAPSGSGASDAETWPLFDNMSFLKQYIQPRPNRCTTNILDDMFSQELLEPISFECSQTNLSSPSELSFSTPIRKRVKKTNSDDDGCFKEACELYKSMCAERSKGSEAVRSFGVMLTSIMNDNNIKQIKAIQVLTNSLFAIKSEPE
ncbi:uncharacterized protein LOC128920016 isoform X2 [Zeugodacus cucurbitae]|uniref:uncharacterized protein LOC128920016 isoform X2 n=1 Tax=Zeugodacus cucurbitae TaxID=28588 RepID=UPI0023D9241A|nr:uncharacterized protein LOC128920016 isoform X2 [Zeugodacus cucurbitae]